MLWIQFDTHKLLRELGFSSSRVLPSHSTRKTFDIENGKLCRGLLLIGVLGRKCSFLKEIKNCMKKSSSLSPSPPKKGGHFMKKNIKTLQNYYLTWDHFLFLIY